MAVVIGLGGVSSTAAAATLTSSTATAWANYVAATEARIARELQSKTEKFLVSDFGTDAAGWRRNVLDGAIFVDAMHSLDSKGQRMDAADGLIAHWRGSVFLPGVTLDRLLDRLQHPSEEGPHQEDVVALRVLNRQPDQLSLYIRMTRQKIVTVTYDTEHRIEYRHHSPTRVSSRSVATRIAEVNHAGTPEESLYKPGEDRGFLWRMNSYWRYEQVPGGVIVELESVTLSRSIPLGLGVIVEPIIDKIARESMTRTLDNLRATYTGKSGLGQRA
jgi:hypothetical protein